MNAAPYDVTSDGERFIVLLRGTAESTGVTQLVMVLDWFDELRRLVPTDD